MEKFDPHLEILLPAQKWLYAQLSKVKFLGSVLYGGMAFSLQYGHRRSDGFDFYSREKLSFKLLKKALPLLDCRELSTGMRKEENALIFEIKNPISKNDSVKLSFFGDIDFGRIGEPKLTNDGILLAASPEDILSIKLKAILERPSAKDYLDIIQVIKREENLERGLAGASLFFENAFSPQIALRRLAYFEDLDPPLQENEMAFLTRMSWEAMENIARNPKSRKPEIYVA